MTGSSPDLADSLLAEPLLALAPSELMFGPEFSLSGEIGMVSRGTCALDLRVFGAPTELDMARVRVWKEVVDAEGRGMGSAEASVSLAFSDLTLIFDL